MTHPLLPHFRPGDRIIVTTKKYDRGGRPDQFGIYGTVLEYGKVIRNYSGGVWDIQVQLDGWQNPCYYAADEVALVEPCQILQPDMDLDEILEAQEIFKGMT